jgi:hypothetical protein
MKNIFYTLFVIKSIKYFQKGERIMRLQELEKYIEQRNQEGLTNIAVTLELDAETTQNVYYVIKTKETYVYGDEQDADEKIDNARQLSGFASAKKKFKAGKISKKSGEELTPDTYTVVIELTH